MPQKKIEPKAVPRRAAPKTKGTVPCPVCASQVPPAKVSQSMVGDLVDVPDEVNVLRAERRVRQSGGDLDELVRAKALRAALSVPETPEPQAGEDECPACQSPAVAVDENRLSNVGKRLIQRKRQENTDAEVSRLIEARRAHKADKVARVTPDVIA